MSDEFKWFPDWSHETCIIVAGGPSAKDAPLADCKGKARVMVVNNGIDLCPWADAVYAADAEWWEVRRGCRTFRGLRVTQSDQAEKMYSGIKRVNLMRTRQIVRSPKGTIAAGSNDRGQHANSGFQALNLAVQFGAKRIVLVGYDMTLNHGLHWHGAHKGPLKNPHPDGVAVWRRNLDAAAEYLNVIGVAVLNASPVSALENYPKVDLLDALQERTAA